MDSGTIKMQAEQPNHEQDENGISAEANPAAPPFLQLTLMSNGVELIETTRKRRKSKAVHYQTSKLSDWGSVRKETRRNSSAVSQVSPQGLPLKSAQSLTRDTRMNERISRSSSVSFYLNSGAIHSDHESDLLLWTNSRRAEDLGSDLRLDLTLLRTPDSNFEPPSSLSRAFGTPPVSYASVSLGVTDTPVRRLMDPEIRSQLSQIEPLFYGTSMFIHQPPTSEELSERHFVSKDFDDIIASCSALKWNDRPFDGDTRTIRASIEAFNNVPEVEFLTGPGFYSDSMHSRTSSSTSYQFSQPSFEHNLLRTPIPEQESHKIPMHPLDYGCADDSSETDILSGPFGNTLSPSPSIFDDTSGKIFSDVLSPREHLQNIGLYNGIRQTRRPKVQASEPKMNI